MNQKKLLYVMNFFFSMGSLGIVTQVPYYACLRFDATSLQLAYFSIIFGGTYIFLAPVMGHYGTRITTKAQLLTGGCLGLFLTSLYVSFGSSLNMLYFYPLLLSFSLSLFYPNMIGSMGQANSMWMISRQAAIFSIGWAVPLTVAPAITGYLMDTFLKLYDRPQYVFLAVSVLPLVAALISFKVHRLDHSGELGQKIEVEDIDRSKLPAGGLLFLLLAWFCLFLVRSPTGIIFNLFPGHAYIMGFSALMVGLLLAVFGLSQAAMFWVLGRFHFWHFTQRPFYIAAVLMIAGMAFMCVAKSFFLIAAIFVLFGFSGAISYHQSMFYSLVVSKNKNRAGGIHESLLVLGNMLTVYLAANMEKSYANAGAAYYVGVAVCLIFLLVIAMTSLAMRIKKQALKV